MIIRCFSHWGVDICQCSIKNGNPEVCCRCLNVLTPNHRWFVQVMWFVGGSPEIFRAVAQPFLASSALINIVAILSYKRCTWSVLTLTHDRDHMKNADGEVPTAVSHSSPIQHVSFNTLYLHHNLTIYICFSLYSLGWGGEGIARCLIFLRARSRVRNRLPALRRVRRRNTSWSPAKRGESDVAVSLAASGRFRAGESATSEEQWSYFFQKKKFC